MHQKKKSSPNLTEQASFVSADLKSSSLGIYSDERTLNIHTRCSALCVCVCVKSRLSPLGIVVWRGTRGGGLAGSPIERASQEVGGRVEPAHSVGDGAHARHRLVRILRRTLLLGQVVWNVRVLLHRRGALAVLLEWHDQLRHTHTHAHAHSGNTLRKWYVYNAK